MPLKTYRGTAVGPLLALAQTEIGSDAVVVRTENVPGAERMVEIVVADPETAKELAKLMPPRVPTASPAAATVAGVSATPRAPAYPQRIAIVGPTGAGKTTTTAKLASHSRVFEGRSVGLLCLDTYRVGAVEQLKSYAVLTERPLEVVYESRDIERATRRLASCDIILIDCPGRGPRNQRDSDAVHFLLDRLEPTEMHLALPSGLQPQLARRLIEHHRSRGATHLLATKVDEVPDDWAIFDLAAELNMPMRWLSDGQRVPQDIRSAAPRLDAARASARSRRSRRQEVVA